MVCILPPRLPCRDDSSEISDAGIADAVSVLALMDFKSDDSPVTNDTGIADTVDMLAPPELLTAADWAAAAALEVVALLDNMCNPLFPLLLTGAPLSPSVGLGGLDSVVAYSSSAWLEALLETFDAATGVNAVKLVPPTVTTFPDSILTLVSWEAMD